MTVEWKCSSNLRRQEGSFVVKLIGLCGVAKYFVIARNLFCWIWVRIFHGSSLQLSEIGLRFCLLCMVQRKSGSLSGVRDISSRGIFLATHHDEVTCVQMHKRWVSLKGTVGKSLASHCSLCIDHSTGQMMSWRTVQRKRKDKGESFRCCCCHLPFGFRNVLSVCENRRLILTRMWWLINTVWSGDLQQWRILRQEFCLTQIRRVNANRIVWLVSCLNANDFVWRKSVAWMRMKWSEWSVA